jgi:electron transport complex protein RnfD
MIETKLKMNISPHQLSKFSTKTIMRDVIIAMIPALIAGIIFFGLYALIIVCLSVFSCVVSEYLYNKIRKKPVTVKDLSAVVTGIILGLNLPPNSPIYIPLIGGVFAIIIVKMLFGGLGKNFANPAATARVFLLFAYISMGSYILPSTISGNYTGFGDLITGSTYLSGGINSSTLQNSFLGFTGLKALNLQLFLGSTGGCIGETSALAILIGLIYLTIRKVVDIRITLTIILTSAFFAFAFTGTINNVLPQILSGGLLFGAVFMATDYATSPMTLSGKIFFAFGIGLITMLIRFYGIYPEGMSLAIVFMNLLVPLIDRYILPVRFGEKRKPIVSIVSICLVAIMSIVLITGGLLTVNKKYNDSVNYEVISCCNDFLGGNYES